ncbi:hypothetical protein ACQKI4_15480, partial [Paenibacillus glucanolyticus]|uniref:hypothetical protein n=1 Tax=Paenibacillus glucanolyticus TaxID=59843 RepID=UPI003D01A1E8
LHFSIGWNILGHEKNCITHGWICSTTHGAGKIRGFENHVAPRLQPRPSVVCVQNTDLPSCCYQTP